jgi:hypothetical protein
LRPALGAGLELVLQAESVLAFGSALGLMMKLSGVVFCADRRGEKSRLNSQVLPEEPQVAPPATHPHNPPARRAADAAITRYFIPFSTIYRPDG